MCTAVGLRFHAAPLEQVQPYFDKQIPTDTITRVLGLFDVYFDSRLVAQKACNRTRAYSAHQTAHGARANLSLSGDSPQAGTLGRCGKALQYTGTAVGASRIGVRGSAPLLAC